MKAPHISRLHLSCAAFLVTIGFVYAEPPAAPSVADDRAMSAGQWAVVAVEWNGKQVDPELLAMLKVVYCADGTWSVLFNRILVAEGRSKNREDESPKTFEMETLGSEGIKPKHYKGIYRIDGDTRVLCIVTDGEPRPEEFSAPRLSGRMLVTLSRVTKLRSRLAPQ